MTDEDRQPRMYSEDEVVRMLDAASELGALSFVTESYGQDSWDREEAREHLDIAQKYKKEIPQHILQRIEREYEANTARDTPGHMLAYHLVNVDNLESLIGDAE